MGKVVKTAKRGLGAVAKAKNRLRKPNVRQQQPTVEEPDNTKTIALVFCSLLISLAYSACFHYFLKEKLFPEKEIEEEIVVVVEDVVVPVVVDQTPIELDSRLKVVESLIEDNKKVHRESAKFLIKLKEMERKIEELPVKGLDEKYTQYDDRMKALEVFAAGNENVDLVAGRMDKRLKAVESVMRDTTSMKETKAEIVQFLQIVEQSAGVHRDQLKLYEELSANMTAVEAKVKDAKSIAKVHPKLDQAMSRAQASEKALESPAKLDDEIAGQVKSADRSLTALISVKNSESCSHVERFSSIVSSGVFEINAPKLGPMFVYCDLRFVGGEWTVFQRRMDGSVDFNKKWMDYVNGFGNLNGEFWMGLERLHLLTSGGRYELRIDIKSWQGVTRYQHYKNFFVGDASTKYRLGVWGESGTSRPKMLNYQNMKFSTFDADNDPHPKINCAGRFKAGWWYKSCGATNFNGLYKKGDKYKFSPRGVHCTCTLVPGKDPYYRFIEMKFRPQR